MEASSLKIIFAGTSDFAAHHLKALIDRKYRICAVLTRPDKPSGRGQKITVKWVKRLAEENNISLYQPQTLQDTSIQNELQRVEPDLIIDVAYGLFLPKEILILPRLGCINVHPSLLPRWRGPAPIQYAILSGDKETGVSIMQVDEGWDTGPILRQERCPILDTDTTADLDERLTDLGIKNLIETLSDFASNTITIVPQKNALVTYSKKITREDAKIDWKKSALEINRQVRAFNPIPGAYTTIGNIVVHIWQAIVLESGSRELPAGTILQLSKAGIDVATGDASLQIQKMQFPGKKILAVADILNSKKDFFRQHHCFL